MQNTGAWEPTVRKRAKPFPGEGTAMTPTTQRIKPMPDHLGPELAYATDIAGDGMIVRVALHHSAKPDSHSLDSVINSTAQMLFNVVEFGHAVAWQRFGVSR
jgi:hypothetical protein